MRDAGAPDVAYAPSTATNLAAPLKRHFDRLVEAPPPQRLACLVEELEQAFERGELRCRGEGRDSLSRRGSR